MAGLFDDLLEQQKQLLATGAPTAPALNWGSIYAQALAEAQAQDPAFAADFGQLSADAKEELQLAVLGPVQEAVSNPDFDVEAVRTAFEQASFDVKIEGTTFSAWRDGELLARFDHIDTAAENATVSIGQMASIVIEGILLLVGLLVQVPAVGSALKRALDAITNALTSSAAYQQAVLAVQAAAAQGSWPLAAALWGMLLSSNAVGVITKVIRALLSSLHWWDYALMVLQVLAYIAASIATGGYAVIAKIVVVLAQTARLISKLANLGTIQALAPATA